jgi:histidinol-phosphate aminotransferase
MQEQNSLTYPQYILNLQPYVAGKPIDEVAREFNIPVESIVKLASNENPYGMSTKARIAIQEYLTANIDSAEFARYPDANQFTLRETISKKYDINSKCISFGNGSNDILEIITRTLVDVHSPDKQSIMFDKHSFMVYSITANAMGIATQIINSKEDFSHDLPSMLAHINKSTQLIFIANPNNPTGTFINANELLNFIQQVPSNIFIVLDEAYNEYLEEQDQYNAILWIEKHPNLVITRTFSKAYGLASLRVGYCIASQEVTSLINRVRQPFNINTLALVAANACLNDNDFLAHTAIQNKLGKQSIYEAFNELNINYIKSYANFVMFKTDNKFASVSGKDLNMILLKRGIIIRPLDSYGLTKYIRVSIGTAQENSHFIQAIKAIYGTYA